MPAPKPTLRDSLLAAMRKIAKEEVRKHDVDPKAHANMK